jgi:anti-sigma B factor antagonist
MTDTAVNAMNIQVLGGNSVTVVVPPGPRIDTEAARDLRAALFHVIDQGSRTLVIDMAGVEFIDSSGLGALVSALKRLKQIDPLGEIRLADVQAGVKAVLEIIRLHRVFPTFGSVDAAAQNARVL